ncbi:unnamed protein product (macronuclear) [Paramecium tetraurelia]|uniref:G-protein coupled receptors family 1 profile domain-containing protein n=1 Tax=Paramecium tetraurelia TaxID=5888 RepID=A0C0C8_PARTE|nr:uncharacterized protein GSPATT00006098001 [Paramecium tetraurelia]CAK64245.1 unnamed protein product [Paramecium tetraurelia]|eukprot:XP_001431643.1 hypothetical protein (macronuclear) [Paramecium tetraurelia strain d4-2]
MSFLSSSFIGLTCILSSKRSFWTFRLISFQSLFECIDLALAFIYNRFFMQQETLEKQCNIIGYIMHSSWLSSFCCCLLIIYQLRLLLKVDNLYETLSKNLFKVIFLFWITSYLWLLFPFLQDEFIPTGWNSFKKDCIQYFFCGFSKSWKIYLIFWTIPQIIIFVSGIIIARKNQKLAAIHLSTFQDEEFEIIQHLQVFPIIYGLAWFVNQIIRYTDIIDVFVKWIVFNDWPYAFYVLFNLIFELHLIIVLGFFLYNYNFQPGVEHKVNLAFCFVLPKKG